MKKGNIVLEKTFNFSLKKIELYKHLTLLKRINYSVIVIKLVEYPHQI